MTQQQRFSWDYCFIEKQKTKFVTIANPEFIVCCTCPYRKKRKKEGVMTEEELERFREEKPYEFVNYVQGLKKKAGVI